MHPNTEALSETVNSLIVDESGEFKVKINKRFDVTLNNLNLENEAVQLAVLRQVERWCVFHAQGLLDLDRNKYFNILEVGAGTGVETLLLLKLFTNSKITSIEPYIDNKVKPYIRNRKVTYSNETFQTFQSKEKFDIIILHFVLEHCNRDSWHELLCKALRLVKEKSLISIVVPNREAFHRELEVELGLGRDKSSMLAPEDALWDHEPLVSNKEIEKQITEAIKFNNSNLDIQFQTIIQRPLSFKNLRLISLPTILAKLYSIGQTNSLTGKGSVSAFLLSNFVHQRAPKNDNNNSLLKLFKVIARKYSDAHLNTDQQKKLHAYILKSFQ